MLNNTLNQSLWLDEATSVLVARDYSFSEIINRFSPGDFHPPLYYFLLKIWISSFGDSEISVRLPSVLFGLGIVYVVYLIASKLFNSKIGLLSVLFIVTGPLHFYYMLEARMYMMETFLVSLIVWFFVKRHWLYLIVTGILLIYTDYLPMLIFLPLLFVSRHDKKILLKLIQSLVIIGFAFLPWIPLFMSQLETGLLVRENAPIWWSILGKTNGKQLLLIPVKFMLGRITFINKGIYSVLVLLSVGLFFIPLSNALNYFNRTKFVWFWLILPIAGASVMGLFMSGFSYFRLIFVLPAFYILTAWGVSEIKGISQKFVIILLILLNISCIGIYITNSKLQKEDWRSAVRFIDENSQENAISVFVTNNQRDPYIYYSKVVPSGGPGLLNSKHPDRIWFFRYVQPIFDVEEKTKAKIEELGYTKLSEHDFNGIVVWEYKKI